MPHPAFRPRPVARSARLLLAPALLAILPLGCDRTDHLSGTYAQTGGPGTLEFTKDRVYVTTLLGMTFVATYEIDGNRVIIKGTGGSQVYKLEGDTLDGGAGMTFIKAVPAPTTTPPGRRR